MVAAGPVVKEVDEEADNQAEEPEGGPEEGEVFGFEELGGGGGAGDEAEAAFDVAGDFAVEDGGAGFKGQGLGWCGVHLFSLSVYLICVVFTALFVKGAGKGNKRVLAGLVEVAVVGEELIFLNARHVGGRRQDASHSQHKFGLRMSSFC